MYEVIKMYGNFEPWWFLDGWEQDIVERQSFESYEQAVKVFQQEWKKLSEQFPHEKSKNNQMVAFWQVEDQYWCEECDEFLQPYHSLLLLENQPQSETEKTVDILPRLQPCTFRRNQQKITGS